VGLVDFADCSMRSEHRFGGRWLRPRATRTPVTLCCLAKAKAASRANRGKDPLLLFNALHRHLGYPEVPRPVKPDENAVALIPQLRCAASSAWNRV
jgi:hypothetical protein